MTEAAIEGFHCSFVWAVGARGAPTGAQGGLLAVGVIDTGAEHAGAARDGPRWRVEFAGEQGLERLADEALGDGIDVDVATPRAALVVVGWEGARAARGGTGRGADVVRASS